MRVAMSGSVAKDVEEGHPKADAKEFSEFRSFNILMGGVCANIITMIGVGLLINPSSPYDLHPIRWGLVCFSGGITGVFVFQRFKHHLGWEKSQQTFDLNVGIFSNSVCTVGSIFLAIYGEFKKS